MGTHRSSREAWGLLIAALLAAAVFASGALDIAAARWFFRPEAADHWPLARAHPWLILYRAAPWITASLLLAGLAALALSLTAAKRHWRGAAALVVLSLVIGPGLIGNVVLKDHWRHPRPRDLVELGGSLHYVPSPLMGSEGGASFPCGHCTVGFLCGLGWWTFRRRHPRWAVVSLAAGLATGGLLGAGRMAAGAHFLSDVIWSALLAFGVTHLLYYHVLRLDAPGSPRRGPRALVTAASLAGACALLAVYVLPHGSDLADTVALSADSPRSLEVEADRASVLIALVDEPATQLTIEGELHGFGLPSAHLGTRIASLPGVAPVLRYSIEARGWLTDVDAFARLTVPASAFDRVRVRVGRGNIRIVDITRAGAGGAGTVQLDLSTGRGTVQRTAGVPNANE